MNGAPASPPSPFERLGSEFLSPPEGATDPGEQVLRPHPLALVGAFARSLVTVAAILVPLMAFAAIGQDQRDVGSLWAAYGRLQLAVAVVVAFAPVTRLLRTRYALDDASVRVRTAILAKQETRVPWEKVTAIRHHRGVLDALLGLERLDIVAYGERGTTLRLVGLRRAGSAATFIARQMRQRASLEALARLD